MTTSYAVSIKRFGCLGFYIATHVHGTSPANMGFPESASSVTALMMSVMRPPLVVVSCASGVEEGV